MSSKRSRRPLRNGAGSFLGCLRQFLTPQLFKQARAAAGAPRRCRWEIQPLLVVLLCMTWCSGELPERFEAARAFYVCLAPKRRRPGRTPEGFLKALSRLPCGVLRLVSQAIRARLLARLDALLYCGGWAAFGCDGTQLACPRTAELEQRLGPSAGKPGPLPSVPQLSVSALVHLRSGLLWAWRLGKGVANERQHLQRLLPTLPAAALVVADCGYQGYELAGALNAAGVAFLIRVSSLTTFYTAGPLAVPAEGCWEALVYYWPTDAQKAGQPPLLVRLLRVRRAGRKHDVWLVSNVLEAGRLSLEQAGQFYKMRWENEGFFRTYKRTLGKVKLLGRTVRQVHREAEGSLLAVQLLLAQGAEARLHYGHKKELGSARGLLDEVRREIREQLRGHRRGRRGYQRRLSQAHRERRPRTSAKEKRVWPGRAKHKPPKPPKIRTLEDQQKALLEKLLQSP
jgi:Transposase DDE domain